MRTETPHRSRMGATSGLSGCTSCNPHAVLPRPAPGWSAEGPAPVRGEQRAKHAFPGEAVGV
eukprot:11703521-Alexandrium_andersonii.AAC.1